MEVQVNSSPQLNPSLSGEVVAPSSGGVKSAKSKIKQLPPSVLKDIELKNHARRLASLAPIKIIVRRCVSCSRLFQSAGNRTCGCNTRSTGFIAGREII